MELRPLIRWNNMKKFVIFCLTLAILLYSICYFRSRCRLTDTEAITIAKRFCQNVDIKHSTEPIIAIDKSISLSKNKRNYAWRPCIDVANPAKAKFVNIDWHISIGLSCNKKDIFSYRDERFYSKNVDNTVGLSSKHGDSNVSSTFIIKENAIRIINSIIANAEVPNDYFFYAIVKDGISGTKLPHWTAYYKKMRGGYPYERDSIEVSINGYTGELMSYTKIDRGTPCSTNVKIDKETAINLGWIQVRKIVGEKMWPSKQNRYVLKSAELLIVQPIFHIGFLFDIEYAKSNSRLAWVIQYSIDPNWTNNVSKEILADHLKLSKAWKEAGSPPSSLKLKIDAESGKLLDKEVVKGAWL